jgi:hypothetical protein
MPTPWLEVNIDKYLPRRSRIKYLPIFIEPEENNCFSIIPRVNIRETVKKTKFCTNLLTTNKEAVNIVKIANQSAREKLYSWFSRDVIAAMLVSHEPKRFLMHMAAMSLSFYSLRND